MSMKFSPTLQDVERYRRLRTAGISLNRKLVETISRLAYEEVEDALGIRRNGALEFDDENIGCLMADCCLFEWYENGKNRVQLYAEAHPPATETDECYLLQAYLEAQYRVLAPRFVVQGAGVYFEDVLNGEELFVMDLAMSRGAIESHTPPLGTRTIPLGEYWMTGGAGLPISSIESALDTVRLMSKETANARQGPYGPAVAIARTSLAAGAARYVSYKSVEASPRRRPRQPRWRPKRGQH
jgi:hypothetical protein